MVENNDSVKNEGNNSIDTERLEFIYQYTLENYKSELNRIKILDDKASGIIGFGGIIVSLWAGLGSFLLKEVSRGTLTYRVGTIFFIEGITLLLFSISYALSAYKIKEFERPQIKVFISKAKDEGKTKEQLLQALIQSLSNAAITNYERNNKKVNFIKISFNCLFWGIVLVPFFVLVLIL